MRSRTGRVLEQIAASKRVTVAGGGWIGLEVAADRTQARELQVTVVETASRRLLRAARCRAEIPDRSGQAAPRDTASESSSNSDRRVHAGFDRAARWRRPVGLTDGRDDDRADVRVVGVGLMVAERRARARRPGIACENGDAWSIDAVSELRTPTSTRPATSPSRPIAGPGGAVRLESWQNAQDQGIAAAQVRARTRGRLSNRCRGSGPTSTSTCRSTAPLRRHVR